MSNIVFPNRDTETGIRYGVIPFNDLFNCGEAFFDSAEDITHADYIQEAKDKLLHAINGVLEDYGLDLTEAQSASDCAFDDIEEKLNERYEPDCPRLAFDDGEYKIDRLLGDETDLFVAKSPYFTLAPECSPCAPGACYLRNGITDEDGAPNKYDKGQFSDVRNPRSNTELLKCYCLGHEWFEDEDGEEKAPYAVYSVETGERVLPKQH